MIFTEAGPKAKDFCSSNVKVHFCLILIARRRANLLKQSLFQKFLLLLFRAERRLLATYRLFGMVNKQVVRNLFSAKKFYFGPCLFALQKAAGTKDAVHKTIFQSSINREFSLILVISHPLITSTKYITISHLCQDYRIVFGTVWKNHTSCNLRLR